ncbi:MAG: DNA polymerase III subunit alpha [Anaerolineales bacterium]
MMHMVRTPIAGFTHLRVHSHYSLLRATASPEQLAARASADGFEALALTDYDALYGVVRFSRACNQYGIRPIIGICVKVEFPFTDSTIDSAGELVLLAMDQSGYRSLCRMSSQLFRKDAAGSRLLNWQTLVQNSEGLICIEAGLSGYLARNHHLKNDQQIRVYLGHLSEHFREDYLIGIEFQNEPQRNLMKEMISFGAQFGVPGVVAQPIFTLEPGDVESLKTLAAIRENCTQEEVSSSMLPHGAAEDQVHWRSLTETTEIFSDFTCEIDRVGDVAARCRGTIPDGTPIWPSIDLPEGSTATDALRDRTLKGCHRKYPGEKVNNRLSHELEILCDRGFASLFLIASEIASFARQTGIPMNTRGSLANSLVAYCLGITDVDPIENDLLFERFLNPARTDLPDLDLDFCSRRRDEVLDFVRRRFGEDRVSLVSTVSRLRLRSAIRETAKTYGFTEEGIKKLASKFPRTWHPDPGRRSMLTVDEAVAKCENELEKTVVQSAYRFIGMPHHISVHPGGVVITPRPLTEFIPTQYAPKGFLITQFDHEDIAHVGIPKLDILGIRALTVLAEARDLVVKHYGTRIDLQDIPSDDKSTSDLVSSGETIGVFQCESDGAQRTLRQLRAQSVKDMAVANAFFKPGPATGGMAKSFIRRYRGEESVTYLHPSLEPILESTKGVLIFQEQILRIATEVAGLDWEVADRIRRGISHFQSAEMSKIEAQFIEGCYRKPPDGPGFTQEQAGTLWEQVRAFSGYGFNKGHATAYANVSFRMAYLKAHWPDAFLCARLMHGGGYHHPVVYIAEARRLGIIVHPPHINFSGRLFSMERRDSSPESSTTLWMGLSGVRDLKIKTIEQIIAERGKRKFDSLSDLIARVSLSKKEITHLIKSGALDGLLDSRAQGLADLEPLLISPSVRQRSFDFMSGRKMPVERTSQRFRWEQELIGMPLSVNPLDLADCDLRIGISLRRHPQVDDEDIEMCGYRLPGWTRGSGFFLTDGENYVRVRVDESMPEARARPPVWRPVRVQGRWLTDEWGGGWLQVGTINKISWDLDAA